MTKPMIRIHNTETNEIIDREMTPAEFTAYQLEVDAATTREHAALEKALNRAALLTKLGITADEAALLLG